MMIKDPWGRLHRVNDQYDNQDFVCTPPESVTFTLPPEDQLSRSGFNWNRASTLSKQNNDVTLTDLEVDEPTKKTKTNW